MQYIYQAFRDLIKYGRVVHHAPLPVKWYHVEAGDPHPLESERGSVLWPGWYTRRRDLNYGWWLEGFINDDDFEWAVHAAFYDNDGHADADTFAGWEKADTFADAMDAVEAALADAIAHNYGVIMGRSGP